MNVFSTLSPVARTDDVYFGTINCIASSIWKTSMLGELIFDII